MNEERSENVYSGGWPSQWRSIDHFPEDLFNDGPPPRTLPPRQLFKRRSPDSPSENGSSSDPSVTAEPIELSDYAQGHPPPAAHRRLLPMAAASIAFLLVGFAILSLISNSNEVAIFQSGSVADVAGDVALADLEPGSLADTAGDVAASAADPASGILWPAIGVRDCLQENTPISVDVSSQAFTLSAPVDTNAHHAEVTLRQESETPGYWSPSSNTWLHEHDDRSFLASVATGRWAIDIFLPPGEYCVTFWTRDASNNRSTSRSQFPFNITPAMSNLAQQPQEQPTSDAINLITSPANGATFVEEASFKVRLKEDAVKTTLIDLDTGTELDPDLANLPGGELQLLAGSYSLQAVDSAGNRDLHHIAVIHKDAALFKHRPTLVPKIAVDPKSPQATAIEALDAWRHGDWDRMGAVASPEAVAFAQQVFAPDHTGPFHDANLRSLADSWHCSQGNYGCSSGSSHCTAGGLTCSIEVLYADSLDGPCCARIFQLTLVSTGDGFELRELVFAGDAGW